MSLIVVGAIHVGLAFALIAGLKSGLIDKLPEELKAEVVQPKDNVKPPPPPPPDLAKPPPPFVPPPEINIASEAPATTALSNTSSVPQPPPPPAVGTRASPRGSRRSCTDLYPPLSLKLNEEGITQVRFTITADGDVTNASVSKASGFDRLDQAALSCIVRWHWNPAMSPQGQPMETETALNIQWKVPK